MLKSCKYCGRIHDMRYDCGRKPKRIRKQSFTEAADFRRTNGWKLLSLSIRDRDNNLCQVCIRQDNPVLTYAGLSVHHIDPLQNSPDRATDRENLITLCAWHHEDAESGLISKDYLWSIAQEQERRADQA